MPNGRADEQSVSFSRCPSLLKYRAIERATIHKGKKKIAVPFSPNQKNKSFSSSFVHWFLFEISCLPNSFKIFFDVITEFQCVECRRCRAVMIKNKIEIVVVDRLFEITSSFGIEIFRRFCFS